MKQSHAFGLALSVLISLAQAQAPINVGFNTNTFFGPDGPWQAVQVSVGANNGGGTVNLYPGGAWQHNILVSTYCNGTTANCPAALAGLYNIEVSANTSAVRIGSNIDQWNGAIAMNITGVRSPVLDTITITDNRNKDGYSIPNSIISAVDTSNIKRPDGVYYPTQVGSLALGAPDFVQVFSETPPTPNINASELTGYLRQSNAIPSSSWGLQIGSTVQSQTGSLVLGGYDQSRLLGTVGVFEYNDVPVAPLIDATLGVETGGTPFNTSDVGSLLVSGGNSSVQMVLNPSVPYMFLPFGMCEAIAQYLPVTFQASVGLYTWNTADPQYKRITTSPAYLKFTFQQSISANLTIKVPFALLDLTLTSPIVSQNTPYFPCKPFGSPNGQWVLGRAFLQAVFLGMNWEQGKVFLAQAPGPKSGPSRVTAIKPGDVSLSAGSIDSWAGTWSQKWTALSNGSTTTGPPSSTTAEPATATQSPSPGLSTGAKAGIGAGVGVLALICIIMAVLFFIRHRRRAQSSTETAAPTGHDASAYHGNGLATEQRQGSPKANDFYAPVPQEPTHELPVPISRTAGLSELDSGNSPRSYR
ncbi:hypothetical protein MMC30_009109 [Trapelia coarctata]|nr:hypothetical protein [Trapelia coarctata]